LTRMSDFDLTCHVRSRGEARDGGRREVSADAGGAKTAATTTTAAKTIVSTSSARRFLFETVIGHCLASVNLAARSEARNFFEVILPHGPKTACIARTWV